MKARLLIIGGMVTASLIFGTYQYIMYQCETLPVYVETPRNPNLWTCLQIWELSEDAPSTEKGYFEDESEQNRHLEEDTPSCTDDRTACHYIDAYQCDPPGWGCGDAGEVFKEAIGK